MSTELLTNYSPLAATLMIGTGTFAVCAANISYGIFCIFVTYKSINCLKDLQIKNNDLK